MSSPAANATHAMYLANVLSIAKVTGSVAASESLAVRSIIHRIGATQEDVVAAGRMLSGGRYRVALPDDRHACVRNLQDMVMVALADGNVTPKEAAPIEEMARLMHYSQADVDMVVRRAQSALSKLGRDRSAPRDLTGSEIAFETEGTPPLPLNPPPPPAPVARVVPNAQRDVRPRSEPVVEPVVEPTVSEDTVPADVQMEDEFGTQPDRVAKCMACRSGSASPAAYCFGAPHGPLNPWGCRLSGLAWTPGAAWLSMGAFRDDVTFVFDKRAMADLLSEKLSDVLACPHFSSKYAETAFSELPARAVIGLRWTYRHAGPDDKHVETIRETRYVHGCAMSSLAAVSGVNPVGNRDALNIIRRAASRAGRDVTFWDCLQGGSVPGIRET